MANEPFVNTAECRATRAKSGLTICPECNDTGRVTRHWAAGGGRIGYSQWNEDCSACRIMGNPRLGWEPLKLDLPEGEAECLRADLKKLFGSGP